MLRRAPFTKLARVGLALLCLELTHAALPANAAPWPTWLATSPAPPTDLAAATTALRTLPDDPAAPALAAHATPEGHWQFTNRAGETFTAGTPSELKRVTKALAPDAKDGFAGVRLILSQDSLFAGASVLRDMPAARTLLVSMDGDLNAARLTPKNTLQVLLRPGVSLDATSKDTFAEALTQLRRPLDATSLRVLSARPGGPATLNAAPHIDAGQGGAAIDFVDPDHLAEALAAIPRQTAILTARLDGALLSIQPPSGPDRTLQLSSLTAAAAQADVDLLILHADPPRQPGGRNWLWQRIEVSGLEHATKRGTLADFLDQLAAGRSVFAVSVTPDGDNRVRLTAIPTPASLTSPDGVTGWIKQATDAVTGQVLGQVTGAVQPASIHASLVSSARRHELSHRVIGNLPWQASALYLAVTLLGLLGLPVARRWWRTLWPREQRAEYTSARGYFLARTIRAAAFLAIFLPLAAVPAVLTRLLALLSPRKPQPQ